MSVEKSSEHKAESQPYSCAMGEERERSFQLHEDSERENIPKLPVVKCCQMLSMYVVFSGQLSLFDLVNSRHSRLQHCRTADCHRIQLCHVPGASGTPAASGVSNCVCWRFSAWNQKSQPLWRESRHLAPRFLHEFFTNSSRILEEFLIFGRFQSFRCKSLSVHAKPDLSVWRVLKVPDRALPPLQGNLGRYPWLHESSLSSLSCNLLVILITQLTYLINSLSIAYHSFQVRTSQNSFHFHSFSFIFIHFQPCGTLVVLVYVFL